MKVGDVELSIMRVKPDSVTPMFNEMKHYVFGCISSTKLNVPCFIIVYSNPLYGKYTVEMEEKWTSKFFTDIENGSLDNFERAIKNSYAPCSCLKIGEEYPKNSEARSGFINPNSALYIRELGRAGEFLVFMIIPLDEQYRFAIEGNMSPLEFFMKHVIVKTCMFYEPEMADILKYVKGKDTSCDPTFQKTLNGILAKDTAESEQDSGSRKASTEVSSLPSLSQCEDVCPTPKCATICGENNSTSHLVIHSSWSISAATFSIEYPIVTLSLTEKSLPGLTIG